MWRTRKQLVGRKKIENEKIEASDGEEEGKK